MAVCGSVDAGPAGGRAAGRWRDPKTVRLGRSAPAGRASRDQTARGSYLAQRGWLEAPFLQITGVALLSEDTGKSH